MRSNKTKASYVNRHYGNWPVERGNRLAKIKKDITTTTKKKGQPPKVKPRQPPKCTGRCRGKENAEIVKVCWTSGVKNMNCSSNLSVGNVANRLQQIINSARQLI